MLIELAIEDFAIIDRVRVSFASAFNVLTGETGAGKSIIIDALSMLRGERADTSLVRAGCSQARVEGVFALADRSDVLPLLEEYGLTLEAGEDQLILSREISAAGRSVARINGRAVSLAVLREIGARLVDIHGQNESLSLFNVRTHLEMLDHYGGLLPLRGQVAGLVDQLTGVRTRINELLRQEARRQDRLEELQLLLDDLSAADLRPDEEETLARERSLLQNGARITALVEQANRLLRGEGEGRRSGAGGVVDALDGVANCIHDLLRFDPTLEGLHEQALEVRYRLDDVIAALRDYREGLDFDPARLEEIDDRLAQLRQLSRKYRVDGSLGLIELLNSAQAELESLATTGQQRTGLEAQERQLLSELSELAGDLSRRRRAAGEELSRRIEATMGELAMPHVRFAVQITHQPDPNGITLDGALVSVDRSGADTVEFLLSPNPGEPLKSLARIASGGESSRLLLALKSILSQADQVPTLVFDEIDVGVGGRSGQVVGEKMWGLTLNHQVLCITHLPQIAAYADAHYVIAKRVEAGRTQTRVRPMGLDERVEEIAAMLDGTPISEASREAARSMLQRAETIKQQLTAGSMVAG